MASLLFGFRNKIKKPAAETQLSCSLPSGRASLKEAALRMRQEESPEKPYSTPRLNKLNFEQASLFLTGHAWNGDADARQLLELLFPMPGEEPPR